MPRRRWGKEGEWGKEIDKEDGTKSRNKSRTTKDFESESETHSKHLQNKSFLDHSGWIMSWKPSLVSVPGIPSPRIGEDLKKPAGQSVIWHGNLYQVISWWQTWQYVASIFEIACLACHVLPSILKKPAGIDPCAHFDWVAYRPLRLFLADFIDTFVSDMTRRKWYLHDWSLPRSRFHHARVYSVASQLTWMLALEELSRSFWPCTLFRMTRCVGMLTFC